MEESKCFSVLNVCCVYPKVVTLELKKGRHNGGLIKYFILPFTSTGSQIQWKPNHTAVLQSIAAGHNAWIMLLCRLACLFYFSQESFVKKILSGVLFPFSCCLNLLVFLQQPGKGRSNLCLSLPFCVCSLHHPTELWKCEYAAACATAVLPDKVVGSKRRDVFSCEGK